jgi:hypothetical protein
MVPPPPKEDKNPLLPHRITIYLRAIPLFSLAIKNIPKIP